MAEPPLHVQRSGNVRAQDVLQEVRRDMPKAVPVQIAQPAEEQAANGANDAGAAQIAPPLEVFCLVFLFCLLVFALVLCFRGFLCSRR